MGLEPAPASARVHVAFFGRRNAGKSSLVNAVAGQDVALVSDVKGTTTDPVQKAMELAPLGPVVLIDTPGFDDEGGLGELRVQRARRVVNRTDVAVIVAEAGITEAGVEAELAAILRAAGIPFLVALNKADVLPALPVEGPGEFTGDVARIPVSAKTGFNIDALRAAIVQLASGTAAASPKSLVAGIVSAGDLAVLVVPIDAGAPAGRLILPQQQTIRDILEAGAGALVTRDTELTAALGRLAAAPALVITDSQAFAEVARAVPPEIPLTSFSILFARRSGALESSLAGAAVLDRLGDGDRVLVCEGCTHRRRCDDIGTVKLPRMIRRHTGAEPDFVFQSGGDFPDDLSPYALVLHCGACMLGAAETRSRRLAAERQGVAFTNYGIAIAKMTGVLQRSVAVFTAAVFTAAGFADNNG